jgi:hypothetical protein
MKKKRENLTDSQISKRIILFYVGIFVLLISLFVGSVFIFPFCGMVRSGKNKDISPRLNEYLFHEDTLSFLALDGLNAPPLGVSNKQTLAEKIITYKHTFSSEQEQTEYVNYLFSYFLTNDDLTVKTLNYVDKEQKRHVKDVASATDFYASQTQTRMTYYIYYSENDVVDGKIENAKELKINVYPWQELSGSVLELIVTYKPNTVFVD